MKLDASLQFKMLLDDLKADYVMEHPFDKAFNRRFRFDFALLDKMVAFEINGGIWTQGRHTRAKGFNQDSIKYFHAGLQGWRVFPISTDWFAHHKRKKYQPHLMYYEDLRDFVKKICTE